MILDFSSDALRNAIACSTASVDDEAKVPVIRDLKLQALSVPKNQSARWCRVVAPSWLLGRHPREQYTITSRGSQVRSGSHCGILGKHSDENTLSR